MRINNAAYLIRIGRRQAADEAAGGRAATAVAGAIAARTARRRARTNGVASTLLDAVAFVAQRIHPCCKRRSRRRHHTAPPHTLATPSFAPAQPLLSLEQPSARSGLRMARVRAKKVKSELLCRCRRALLVFVVLGAEVEGALRRLDREAEALLLVVGGLNGTGVVELDHTEMAARLLLAIIQRTALHPIARAAAVSLALADGRTRSRADTAAAVTAAAAAESLPRITKSHVKKEQKYQHRNPTAAAAAFFAA
jgi:hypothetical protein